MNSIRRIVTLAATALGLALGLAFGALALGSGSASAAPTVNWDAIAQCESGGNWAINTGNGYYGGLQFSAQTWKSVGGPGLPHQNSREVQIKYAKILQQRAGWGQWSCAAKVGVH